MVKTCQGIEIPCNRNNLYCRYDCCAVLHTLLVQYLKACLYEKDRNSPNEGSGMGSSESDIKKLCPTAEVKIGLQLNGSGVNSADGQIESWLKSNGLM